MNHTSSGLRHVVDGGVEALLFQRQSLLRQSMLLRQFADDEKQHGVITSIDSAATAIRNLTCSRQSASAAHTVLAATTEIGNSSMRAPN